MPYLPPAVHAPPSQPRDQLVASYGYDLPPAAIAQAPAAQRHEARLLVVRDGQHGHRSVADLPDLLEPGDLLVVNDTKVLPVRLFARKPTGGLVQILLVRPHADGGWHAMVKPSKKVQEGLEVRLQRRSDGVDGPGVIVGATTGEGTRHVRAAEAPLDEDLLAEWGELPLPPYIERDAPADSDGTRYQTVFAEHAGAVAAPTAGLHFSEDLLSRVNARGIQTARVTLHVGPGTFRPVRTDTVAEHPMHAESYRVPHATARAVAKAEARGGRIVAVGTTSCRSLEAWHRAGRPADGRWRSTDLFLHPGAEATLPLSLLTNFHLPGSTLLMLVASFLGRERTLALYADALTAGYRFYSYGDAMLLL